MSSSVGLWLRISTSCLPVLHWQVMEISNNVRICKPPWEENRIVWMLNPMCLWNRSARVEQVVEILMSSVVSVQTMFEKSWMGLPTRLCLVSTVLMDVRLPWTNKPSTWSGPGKVVFLVGLAFLTFLGHKLNSHASSNSIHFVQIIANEVIATTGAWLQVLQLQTARLDLIISKINLFLGSVDSLTVFNV